MREWPDRDANADDGRSACVNAYERVLRSRSRVMWSDVLLGIVVAVPGSSNAAVLLLGIVKRETDARKETSKEKPVRIEWPPKASPGV